ncbi:MAG: hypothetical protein AB7P24_20220 [Nitrospira sp.]
MTVPLIASDFIMMMEQHDLVMALDAEGVALEPAAQGQGSVQ